LIGQSANNIYRHYNRHGKRDSVRLPNRTIANPADYSAYQLQCLSTTMLVNYKTCSVLAITKKAKHNALAVLCFYDI